MEAVLVRLKSDDWPVNRIAQRETAQVHTVQPPHFNRSGPALILIVSL